MDKRFILGNYYVTRVKDASPIDFDKAMKYSDNIYFAQQALKIGKDQYVNELKKYGFHEKLLIEYEFPISIIARDGIRNDIQLADTGYGQGQVLMTPLHLALTYAPIVNEGNIPSPHLLKEAKVAGIGKKMWFLKESRNIKECINQSH